MNRLAKNSDLHFLPRFAPPVVLNANPSFWWLESEAQEPSSSNPSADSPGSSFEMPSECDHFFPQPCYHSGLSCHHSLGYCHQLLTSLPEWTSDHVSPLREIPHGSSSHLKGEFLGHA